MADKPLNTQKLGKMAKDAVGRARDFVSEKSVSEESRLWGALCYIIIVLLPLVVLLTEKKKDRFVAFHAYHSLVLFAATIVYSIALSILDFIVDKMASLLSLLLLPLYFVPLLIFLLAAWNAYKGKKLRLPVTTEIAEKAAG